MTTQLPDRIPDLTTESAPVPRAGDLRALISRRPVISFFVLAFGLSWLAWIPYVLSRSGLGIWDFDFPTVLGTTQLLGMLPGAYLGPIVSAFLVTAISSGRAGLAEWLGRFRRWRVDWRAYLAVIAGVPLSLTVIGLLLSGGRDVQLPAVSVLLVYLPMLALQMVTTGLAEEPGWRDFALPKLQPRFGSLGGSLILGPLWGCWHLPLFLTSWGNWPNVRIVDVIEFVGTAMAICIVMTWVFNRTNQSLPLQMILHSSINTYASVVWSGVFPTMDHAAITHGIGITAGIAALILVVVTRGRLGWSGPAFG
ncbi:CPBP family intramembrane glutamic endopeptidase [Microlunatus soli]|uniref:CAAX protease self-immunity n=1 Tax=Microlunatus soli TaxID=630515 RepID=A0A1H1P8A0_9ACTN|nr:CPBP family intramembrane glutamic endopeptidase [Microlunatus soli]SDS07528.1 CAAX protease self-immunity [Microlunatus soli]